MMRAATEVLVARRGSFSGTILIADNLRTEAVTAVHDLKHMGLTSHGRFQSRRGKCSESFGCRWRITELAESEVG
jgi:hypothetical protein